MKAELKKKWIEALRSGKYKQISGKLCDNDDEFCALGVLCKVSGAGQFVRRSFATTDMYDMPLPPTVKHLFILDNAEDKDDNFPMSAAYADLTDDICEALGISWLFSKNIAAANDKGVSFKDLAKGIENDVYGDFSA